jgi:hypothetical protein
MTWGYYAYVIGNDGHIRNRIEVLCDNDGEARRCAERLVDGHVIELWQEARTIATLEPKRASK